MVKEFPTHSQITVIRNCLQAFTFHSVIFPNTIPFMQWLQKGCRNGWKCTLLFFYFMSEPKPKTFTLFLIDNWSKANQCRSHQVCSLSSSVGQRAQSLTLQEVSPTTNERLSYCHRTKRCPDNCSTMCLCSSFWSLLHLFSLRKLLAARIWRAASLRSRGASTSPAPSPESSMAALKWVRASPPPTGH